MKQAVATIIDNHQVSSWAHSSLGRVVSGNHLTLIDCSQITPEAQPGQFVMVRCGQECTLPRPFSIHRVNDNVLSLFFSVWEDGKGTKWLSERQEGDPVELLGPLGNSFTIHPDSKNLLLVAGGVGIAPLRFLADQSLSKGCSVRLLLGTKTRAQLNHEYLLPPEIEVVTATEDGSMGQKGKATDLLPESTDWADQIFACGPAPMYRDMALRKSELKLEGKPVQISLEVRMGCGLGVCYACTVKTRQGLKQVCRDGPVFDLDDILWDEFNC